MKAWIAATFGVALLLGACGLSSDPVVTPSGPLIAVRPPSLTLAVGATDTLFAFMSGIDSGADRTMDWSAGDTTIVRVTTVTPPDHALVLGLKAGTTAVTVSWRKDPTVRAMSAVMVR